jgi:regulator of protease activity HflC (stomatin/prohibitin superfamily)
MWSLTLLLPLTLFLLAGIRRVPEGNAITVYRFGRYARTLAPGVGFVLPLVERAGHRVSLIGHSVPLHDASENTDPETDEESDASGPIGAVHYQILDPRLTGIALEDVDALVRREASEQLLQLLPRGEQPDQAARLKAALNARLGSMGLYIVRCQLVSAS